MNSAFFGPPAIIIVLFFAIFIVIAIGILFTIIRALTRSGPSAGSGLRGLSQSATTALGDDGFWITSCGASPGSMLQYYFWTNGVRKAGQVPFQPGADGRQFIYTGVRPESVAIAQIGQPFEDDSPGLSVPLAGAAASFWGSSNDSSSSHSSASSRFPSAY